MAQKNFQVDLNLNLNQLLQTRLENVTTLPAENLNVQAGRMVYLSADKHVYKCDGAKWQKLVEDDDAKVTLAKDSTGLVYTLSQGGTEIGKINIPKDMVVQSGSVVKGTFAQDGSFTESTSGKDTALKLVIANSSDIVYINVKDLATAYTGGTTADATVSISSTGAITVTLSQAVHNQLSRAENLHDGLYYESDPLVGDSGTIDNDTNGLKASYPATLQCFKGDEEIIISLSWKASTGVISWAANTKFTAEDNVRIVAMQAGLA